MSFLPSGYGQDDVSKSITKNANPIVYHLTSNDPWRASIAISDAINLNNLGYNITVLLRAYPKTLPLLYVIHAQTKCNIAT